MGASTKNAGFACFGSISEIENDRKKMPDLDLLSLIELRVLGLKKLRNVLGDKNISFSKFGGYELFFNKKKIEDRVDKINNFLEPLMGKSCF